MKRSGPPARRSPLRRTAFKRSPSVRRRPAATKTKIPKKVRDAVERRAGGKCEIRANGHCEDRGYHCHHRLMRSHGGKHTAENLLLTCATCHAYVHQHRPQAYEMGWILRGVA